MPDAADTLGVPQSEDCAVVAGLAFCVPPFCRLGKSFMREPQASHWPSGPTPQLQGLGELGTEVGGAFQGPGPKPHPCTPTPSDVFPSLCREVRGTSPRALPFPGPYCPSHRLLPMETAQKQESLLSSRGHRNPRRLLLARDGGRGRGTGGQQGGVRLSQKDLGTGWVGGQSWVPLLDRGYRRWRGEPAAGGLEGLGIWSPPAQPLTHLHPTWASSLSQWLKVSSGTGSAHGLMG